MTTKLNVLIIGSGGREYALGWKIAQSPRAGKLYATPGNAGTEQIAENVDIKVTDFSGLIKFDQQNNIGLIIVGSDDQLAAGIVDAFQAAGLRTFGPSKKAARIESSKAFSKNLMQKMSIPTAKFEIFNDHDEPLKYISNQKMPIIIKANGLALGKGVLICQTMDEAKTASSSIMIEKTFGDTGNEIVVEGSWGTIKRFVFTVLLTEKRRSFFQRLRIINQFMTTIKVQTPAVWEYMCQFHGRVKNIRLGRLKK